MHVMMVITAFTRIVCAGQSHVRVMHSEVHALVKLPDPENAKGMHCWIVELDEHGESVHK